MTPKLSFVTAVVGAALVLAVPAYGDPWGADRSAAMVHVSPDLVDRVAAARQQELSSMLDARERSFAARSDASIVSPDPVRDDRFQLDPASIRDSAPERSARPTRSSGCRSESGSAAASYWRSASSWRRG